MAPELRWSRREEQMKENAIHDSSRLRAAGRCLLVGLLLGASLQNVSAQGSGAQALVGAWAIQVTLRDCATTAPLGPAIRTLVTFHQDGTISETQGGVAFLPGQRSPAHGTWTHDGGNRFVQKMLALILFDSAPNPPVSPGFSTGWQTVTHNIEVSGDTLTSSGVNAFFRADRSQYRTGCSTATGERFR
jgi:hypothetical protein